MTAIANSSFDTARYERRKFGNRLVLSLSLVATTIGLAFLAWIFVTLIYHGLAAWNLALFTMDTPAAGSIGGLRNAIMGSVLLTLTGLAIGAPIGILAGTYLAEYAARSRVGEVIQFVNDILLSTPSIIVGLFVWNVVVYPTGRFSGWAGAVALAVLVIPVVVRTTVDMLGLVPNGLREAAAALGTPKWKIITLVSYRAAVQGLLTGVLLAVARISGETAPLLFTSLGNQFWSTDMSRPIASLPSVIFDFALSPYKDLQQIAWGGALLITVAILILNITARSLANLGSLK